jgi:hypothetical protein
MGSLMGSLNSRKKSRNSINHSRVSSKTSKDLSITKLKALGDKRALFLENPIQEVADQEVKSTNSNNEDKGEVSPMHVEGITQNRRHSQLPISVKLTSKIKSKYTKSFSKAAMKREQQALKNSTLSVNTDYLSLSMKGSPADKGRDMREQDTEREKFKTLHVQKLITNLKKGSISIKKDMPETAGNMAGTRPESALSKFVTSQVGQSLTVGPATAKMIKEPSTQTKKMVNHRRTFSDTNSLHYQKTSKGINSARNRTVLNGTLMKPVETPSVESPIKENDYPEASNKYSTMSNRSSNQAQEIEAEVGDNECLPINKFMTDFARKPQPKTVTNISKADQKESKRITEENDRLKDENLRQKRVAFTESENRRARKPNPEV